MTRLPGLSETRGGDNSGARGRPSLTDTVVRQSAVRKPCQRPVCHLPQHLLPSTTTIGGFVPEG